jgi:UDP-N-acetylmuramyl pentapeptide phosphotransferase/UDP-N-acetylglucosamine-1-phosphate transferase
MIGDILVNIVGEALFEVAFYCVGFLSIRVISLGRWHCFPPLSEVPRRDTRWGGLIHRRTDSVHFTSRGTAAVGGLVCLVVVVVAVLLWVHFSLR